MVPRIGRLLRACAAATAVAGVLGAAAGSAAAYTVADGWTVSNYATGFPSPTEGAGPLGVVFDQNANLLVTDTAVGTYYRVPPGGGTAAASLATSGLPTPAGLSFGLDGKLYMARQHGGEIDEIDPANASTIRVVKTGLSCPTALATDPMSGDLFVSQPCDGAIMRVVAPATATPDTPADWYSNVVADGIAFSPDGRLFAADGGAVDLIDPSTRVGNSIASVPTVDGLVYAPATSGSPEYLVADRNDGEIDSVALDGSGTLTPIVTGASRGDLVTVGPDQCLYATLQTSIIKIGPSTGACYFTPPAGTNESSGGGDGSGGGGSNDGQGGVLGERAAQNLADLGVTVRAPKKVKRGSRFTYTITVSNHGPATAPRVVLTDQLAGGLKFISARQAGVRKSPCRRKGRTVTCTVASLASGKSLRIQIVVRAVRGARYTNKASVKSRNLDSVPGNNTATTQTRVRR
jgi:uncharacterized repeat protein (TIGR01451 family)